MRTPANLGDTTGAVAQAPAQRPARGVSQAARQFEALLIGQLLKGRAQTRKAAGSAAGRTPAAPPRRSWPKSNSHRLWRKVEAWG